MQNQFFLPSFEYLNFENIYSGSQGEFCFKLFPDTENSILRIAVWKGPNCLQKSESITYHEVALSSSGWEKGRQWIYEQYTNLSRQTQG